jgi:sugar lactone lactonase YvrE
VTGTLVLLLAGGALFECPRWHDGAWWVSDIDVQQVLRVTTSGEATTILRLDGDDRPAGLGWLPGGELLVVVNNRRTVLRIDSDGTVTIHADAADQVSTHGNFNDVVVDRDGRAFISSMGARNLGTARTGVPAPTCITVLDPDGRRHDEGADLNYPNGMVLTDDGSTLIVAETGGRRLTAFDVTADGRLRRQRAWADLSPHDHWPDGCCLAADGSVRSASPRGNRGWQRVAADGAVLDTITTEPGVGAYACMLGGPAGRTLLLCARADENLRPGCGP